MCSMGLIRTICSNRLIRKVFTHIAPCLSFSTVSCIELTESQTVREICLLADCDCQTVSTDKELCIFNPGFFQSCNLFFFNVTRSILEVSFACSESFEACTCAGNTYFSSHTMLSIELLVDDFHYWKYCGRSITDD